MWAWICIQGVSVCLAPDKKAWTPASRPQLDQGDIHFYMLFFYRSASSSYVPWSNAPPHHQRGIEFFRVLSFVFSLMTALLGVLGFAFDTERESLLYIWIDRMLINVGSEVSWYTESDDIIYKCTRFCAPSCGLRGYFLPFESFWLGHSVVMTSIWSLKIDFY